ncbi:hypothetical protein ACFLWN_02835 [Chloroflexota bacterium]
MATWLYIFLILVFCPGMTVASIYMFSVDVFRASMILLSTECLVAVGSYYQWVKPKNRSKLWLLFPMIFGVFGYIPLMFLKKRNRIYSYLNTGYYLIKSVDAPDIFAYIAMKITKYYLELIKHYFNRFDTEAALIATAGFISLPGCIERGEISPEQILNITKGACQTKGEALVNFIINLEIKVFSIRLKNEVGDQQFEISEIKEACFKKREDINSAVQKVKNEYIREEEFSSFTSFFFKSPQFGDFRKALGIEPVLMKTDFENYILKS